MPTVWYEAPTSVLHTKQNGDTYILNVGDCIIYEGRDFPVRILQFYGDNEVTGFTYLPWRGERWATPVMTMRGDPRFMICYPGGLLKYGQHMNWSSVKVVPNPEIEIESL